MMLPRHPDARSTRAVIFNERSTKPIISNERNIQPVIPANDAYSVIHASSCPHSGVLPGGRGSSVFLYVDGKTPGPRYELSGVTE
jgi:hypothetical protein